MCLQAALGTRGVSNAVPLTRLRCDCDVARRILAPTTHPHPHTRGTEKYYKCLFEKHSELPEEKPKLEYLCDDEGVPVQHPKRQRLKCDQALFDAVFNDGVQVHALEDGSMDAGASSSDDALCSAGSRSSAERAAGGSAVVAPPGSGAVAEPSPQANHRDDVPIGSARHGRVGEFEMWFGHRFTKVKRNKVWTGWQCVCGRHTDPSKGQSAKCSRARTFRGVAGLDYEDPLFLVENELLLNVLRHWAVAECDPNSKAGHMKAGDASEEDFMSDDILSTTAMLCDFGHSGAGVSNDDDRPPPLALLEQEGGEAASNRSESDPSESDSSHSTSQGGSQRPCGASSVSDSDDLT